LKRLAAIVFFVVILFNFYGYRVVIAYMQSNSDVQAEEQIDKNNYNEQQLVSIKTKLDLPYYSSSPDYERAYGAITINGINYQYVKRRVYRDTLELLCLPNEAKTKLQSVKNELAKSFADGQPSTPKKNTTIKITLPDFFQPVKPFSTACFISISQLLPVYKASLTTGFTLKQKRPPKTLLFFSC
jgi:hypothetical protein